MNKRKQLPKAILWTANEMREAESGTGQRREIQHPASLNEPATGRTPGAVDNVIEMMPKPDSAPSAAGNNSPANTLSDRELAKRRLRALAIVERHANFSAIGGVIPLPIINMASITAIIIRMVRLLSQLYGVPFQRNRARAIVIGLMGGVMPTGLATIATSTLIYFVPGYNLVGLAVSSVSASAYARSIGQLLIEHFEKGSTLVDFPSVALR
jgi:uncharacterized protein (DUF697 family)